MKHEVSRYGRTLAVVNALTLLALIALLLSQPHLAYAADEVYSGRCGETTSWVLDSDGVLTVSGTGAVVYKGYNDSYLAPNNFAVYGSGTGSGYLYMQHLAKAIVIEEGITSLEGSLFKNYRQIESLSLPSTLKAIEPSTFANCSGLKTVVFAGTAGPTVIADGAFSDCWLLESISIPAATESIGANAFSDCAALTRIAVAKGSKLQNIGNEAFSGCVGLQSADFSNATSLKTIGANVFDPSLLHSEITSTKAKKGCKLIVNWNKTIGASKYVVYYKPVTATKYKSATVKAVKKTLTKLKANKQYSVYVEAQLAGTVLCTSPKATSDKIKK